MRNFLMAFVFFGLIYSPLKAQLMRISGTLQDTSSKASLQYGVAMAIRLQDSMLVQFSRSNKEGRFELSKLPIDTYQVIISHPNFGEKEFLVVGNSENVEFDFGKIAMPPKTVSMKEVTVYAYKDPIYFKGDTLVYTADSFKVRPNATVEDLLKKLPGIRVDAAGKITAQGKEVDQVLVDGDEFFGSDPTVATRNLGADGLQTVEIYEKKNENATGEGDKETLKVMNLKLKDEAKKGYFGKIAGASDAQKYHEGEALFNSFNKKRKISLFGIGTNTPKRGFDGNDVFQYGLSNEFNQFEDEDGGMFSYYNGGNTGNIPQTIKGGAYFADKIGKKVKLNSDYTYSNVELLTKNETRTQYFLEDTSYTTSRTSSSIQRDQSHNAKFDIEFPIDSLTEIKISPGVKYSFSNKRSQDDNIFITEDELESRNTEVQSTNDGNNLSLKNHTRIRRNFKKKDRRLVFNHNYNYDLNKSLNFLYSENNYLIDSLTPSDTLRQKKQNETLNQSHNFSISYTEPFTAKFKAEINYDYYYNEGNGDKRTFDFYNGEYSLENAYFSNRFMNIKNTHRAGLRLIYEVKKYKLSAGVRYRNVEIINNNQVTKLKTRQINGFALPFANFRYRFSENKSFEISYNSNASAPELNQLQPLPDNSNPNAIYIGNPTLKPSFSNDINLNFYSFKPLSGRNIFLGANFNHVINDFSNDVVYDNLGRTITKPINVNGNYNGNAYLNGTFPINALKLKVSPSLDAGINNQVNKVNGLLQFTREYSAGAGLDLSLDLDKFYFSAGGNFNYNDPESSISSQSNQPYYSQSYFADLSWELPKKFMFNTDARYVINSRRTSGYNIDFIIWNASISRKFFKKDNLEIAVEANDILNQNVNTSRNVMSNRIVDSKTNVIQRYILFKAVWRFKDKNSKKGEDEE